MPRPRSRANRARISPSAALLAGLIVVAVFGVVLATRSGGGSGISIARSGKLPRPVDPTLAATATARTAPPELTATETEEPYIGSIEELVATYGEPPDASFARLRIPVLGVDAPVRASFVGEGEAMETPLSPVEAVWYDMSGYPGTGGAPGEGRNAIFSGHVDFLGPVPYAGMEYRGLGVFAGLGMLSPGDVIEVVYGGQTLTYAMTWRREVAAQGNAWAGIWSDQVSVDSITLYTCGGEFDYDTQSYPDRIVVRAERVS